MLRRFTSHILIGLATFVLTATLFMWVLNNRVFDPDTLNAELKKAGVIDEFTSLLPEIITPDEDASLEEKEQFREVVDEVLTVSYVNEKISDLNTSVITFIKDGEPDPVLDISDLKQEFEERGIELEEEARSQVPETVNTEEYEKYIDSEKVQEELQNESEEFSFKPINLNEDGSFDAAHRAYKTFSLLSVLGIIIFVVLMMLEWFVAEKGKKLRRLSRVFLYAGLSYAIYWVLVVLLPKWAASRIDETAVKAEYDTSGLVTSVLQAIEGLFAFYFLLFAAVGIGITVLLYLIRHFKHDDVATS